VTKNYGKNVASCLDESQVLKAIKAVVSNSVRQSDY